MPKLRFDFKFGSHTEAFLSRSRKKLESMPVEAEKIKADMKDLEARMPRWGTSGGSVAVRSQGATKSFCSGQRPPRGNPSIAVEDCTDGGVSKWSMRPRVEKTQDFGVFFRSGVVGRRTRHRAADSDVSRSPASDRDTEGMRL